MWTASMEGSRDGGDFDLLDVAQGFEMDAAHKSGAEDGGADAVGHIFT